MKYQLKLKKMNSMNKSNQERSKTKLIIKNSLHGESLSIISKIIKKLIKEIKDLRISKEQDKIFRIKDQVIKLKSRVQILEHYQNKKKKEDYKNYLS